MNISHVKKNRKVLSFLIVTGMTALLNCVFPASTFAGQGEDLFALGNQAYSEGKYDKAVSCYKGAIEREGYSASLLYNMANAYYQKKDIGLAILNYERALFLDPGNADIKANLRLAQKDFGLISEEARGWQRFFDLLNLNWWSLLASSALGAFSLLFLLKGMRPGILRGASPKLATIVCLTVFMFSGTGVTVQYRNLSRAVVTQDDARLLVSPFDSAFSSESIKGGKIVRMAKSYKDYVLVEGLNGKSGWVQKNAIAPIVPYGDYS
ncbi:MAG: tetratricopeptide repeat protein [Desulfobacterales bacterium]|jgi:tetratricopeptide (TPR) repeat protein|nr:tetratricopeptide repeat protein [Desulfobacterales bacterium]